MSTKNSELPEFLDGQGYPIQSYLNGVSSLEETFARSKQAVTSTREGPFDHRLTPWPRATHVASWWSKFDPSDELFRGGAHAPLLTYFGEVNRRTPQALHRREQRAIARGFGPGSDKRSALMQAQGKGPRPGSREWEEMQGHGKGKVEGKTKNTGEGNTAGTRDCGAGKNGSKG